MKALLKASIAFLFLFAVSCSPSKVDIKEIKDNIKEYQGKEVTVVGKVTNSVNLGSLKYYEVKDETGKIYVSCKNTVPKEGEEKSVTGTVNQVLKIGIMEVIAIEEKE